MSATLRLRLIIIVSATFLFSAVARGQDDKDDIIAKQQQQIELLKKQIELRDKREQELVLQFKKAEEQKALLEVRARQLEATIRALEFGVLQDKMKRKAVQQEMQLLNKIVQEREAAIAVLETNLKIQRIQLANSEAFVKTLKARNEELIALVRELTVRLAKPDGGAAADPNQPNPPAVLVNGKVSKISGDVLEITLGTDHGVMKDHTLDVFRTQPEPKYLGMIRIVEVSQQKSIARFVRTGAAAPTLREGDRVTSRISDVKKD